MAVSASARLPLQWRDYSLKPLQGIESPKDTTATNTLQTVKGDNGTIALLEKAQAELDNHDWEKAIATCGKVLSADPKSLAALFYRAFAQVSLRRYAAAQADYEAFLRLSPENLEARIGLIYTCQEQKLYTKALDEANLAVELHTDSAAAYAVRSGIEKELSYIDTALFDISKAVELAPGNTDYMLSKAEILILLNRKREAKTLLDEASKTGADRGSLRDLYEKFR